MAGLFVTLFLLSFVGLIVGLISPRTVIRWGDKRIRSQVLLIYGLALIVFFVLVGVTAPPRKQDKGKPAVIRSVTMKKTGNQEGQPEAWDHDSVVLTEAEGRKGDPARVGKHKPTQELPFGPWTATTICSTSLYAKPFLGSSELSHVPEGTRLEAQVEKVDSLGATDWIEVTYKGKTGWIQGSLTDKVHAIPTDSSNAPQPVDTGKGKYVVIATAGTRARLSSIPDSPPLNREILRIPEGTRLRVEEERVNREGPWPVSWYKVTYAGSTGWISEYDTRQ